VFAELRYPRDGRGSVDDLRFVSWPTGDAILALRPCFYVPGRWRSHRRVHITHLRALADEGGTWEGVEVRELLVALDAWLEAGCPKRRRRQLTAASTPSPGQIRAVLAKYSEGK
jgi:hypothetical protein